MWTSGSKIREWNQRDAESYYPIFKLKSAPEVDSEISLVRGLVDVTYHDLLRTQCGLSQVSLILHTTHVIYVWNYDHVDLTTVAGIGPSL